MDLLPCPTTSLQGSSAHSGIGYSTMQKVWVVSLVVHSEAESLHRAPQCILQGVGASVDMEGQFVVLNPKRKNHVLRRDPQDEPPQEFVSCWLFVC